MIWGLCLFIMPSLIHSTQSLIQPLIYWQKVSLHSYDSNSPRTSKRALATCNYKETFNFASEYSNKWVVEQARTRQRKVRSNFSAHCVIREHVTTSVLVFLCRLLFWWRWYLVFTVFWSKWWSARFRPSCNIFPCFDVWGRVNCQVWLTV